MKLDSKEKILYVQKFITNLYLNPRITPFLDIGEIVKVGLHDFRYYYKDQISLKQIQLNLKDSKYDNIVQVGQKLKRVFQIVGDYLFIDDPLQQQVNYFISQINNFCEKTSKCPKQTFISDSKFIQITSGSKNKQKQKKISYHRKQQKNNHPQIHQTYKFSSLSQKLQMVFFLKAHQQKQSYIQSIMSCYNIGQQKEDQYVIKLDQSRNWVDFLQKRVN